MHPPTLVVVFCLLVLGTGHCVARVCINYLMPITTVMQRYETGSTELIRRACWDESDKWDQLIDTSPKDGTADGYETEDLIARAYNMIFEASYDYQKDVCKKNPDSQYCCKNGVSTVDALEKHACWLKQGQSTYINGERITATNSTKRGSTKRSSFKVSYVWTYRCNGETDYKNVSVSYDVYYQSQCAAPNNVWKKSFTKQ